MTEKSDRDPVAVFQAAPLEGTPDQLAAYLSEACGEDSGLRAQVEAMIAADRDEEDSFMVRAPWEGPSAGEVPTIAASSGAGEQPGDTIGNFKLLQKIGEGGFGVVYMAEQLEPVKRRVALKIIKLGMDTRQVVARFEVERQALAMMDHPNIAKVLDAGATETGRPYFVMDLVRGMPITTFCDDNNLSTRERLELFLPVCQAVQHAHQKGLIHRDLKPSNVLVTMHDDLPVPKVIDFGVAKATQGDLTDQTLFTRFEQFIGTPAYMSPEQAQMSGLDIDTRSDIYALGVLLYELLTGGTPFDQRELMKAGYEEIRRVIREEEPPKPSTRLLTLKGAELTTVAKHRRCDPQKLRVGLRGDLDWVIMKALEKNRTRRYDSATALADDIRRHLANEPVLAVAPSVGYRLRKYARRHRAALAVAAVITLLLVVATVVSTIQARENARLAVEADAERLKAVELKDEAEELAGIASRAQLRAEEEAARAGKERRNTVFELLESRLLSGVTELVSYLRSHPQDSVAATRLISLLVERQFARPVIPPIANGDRAWFDEGGGVFVTTDSAGFGAQVWRVDGRPLGERIAFEEPVSWAAFQPGSQGKVLLLKGGKGAGKVSLVEILKFEVASNRWQPFARFEHEGWINELHFSPDGNQLLTASGTSGFLWEVDSGAKRSLLQRQGCEGGAWSPDGVRVALGGSDGITRLYDVVTGQEVRKMDQKHELGKWVTEVHFSPDGQSILTSSKDGTARLWSARSGEALTPPLPHEDVVEAARFARDGALVVTASRDGTACVWDAATGARLVELKHESAVTMADFDPTGSRVVTGTLRGVVQVWDVATGRKIGPAFFHAKAISTVRFSPDGSTILSAADQGTTRLWKAPGFIPAGRAHWTSSPDAPFDGLMKALAFSPDGTLLATASRENPTAFQVWDVRTGRLRASLGHWLKTKAWVEFSPDGGKLITASETHGVRVWDTSDRGAESRVDLAGTKPSDKPAYNYVYHATFSPDNQWVAGGILNEDVALVWNLGAGGELLTDPLTHDAPVVHVDFHPEGDLLATATLRGLVRIWRVKEGEAECLATIEADPSHGVVLVAEFSPDGRQLLTTAEDGVARIWDVSQVRERVVIDPLAPVVPWQGECIELRHVAAVNFAEFSPDGRWVVTASDDGTARVWDAATGEPVGKPMQHERAVRTARFSPDGLRVVTASLDETARVWDAGTGFALSEPMRHDGPVYSARFSPDGRRVASGGDDLAVRIWEVAPLSANEGVPGWFLDWSDALVGVSTSEGGWGRPMSWEECRDALARGKASASSDDYGTVVKWIMEGVETSPLSPFSSLTREDYVASCLAENRRESLEEAILIDPTSVEALEALARHLLDVPATATPKLRVARHYAERAKRLRPDDARLEELAVRIDQAIHLHGEVGRLRQRALEQGDVGQARQFALAAELAEMVIQSEADWPREGAKVQDGLAGLPVEERAGVLEVLLADFPKVGQPDRLRARVQAALQEGADLAAMSKSALDFRAKVQARLGHREEAVAALDALLARIDESIPGEGLIPDDFDGLVGVEAAMGAKEKLLEDKRRFLNPQDSARLTDEELKPLRKRRNEIRALVVEGAARETATR